jgi:hypothetical protein
MQRIPSINISLSGLVYTFRYFNRHIHKFSEQHGENIVKKENIENKEKKNSYMTTKAIQPYLKYFNYYNANNLQEQKKDWELFHSLKTYHDMNNVEKQNILKHYRETLLDDIYYDIHNGENTDFDQNIYGNLLARYIDEVYTIFNMNTSSYIQSCYHIKELFNKPQYNTPSYESIQIDNNEIYSLRLVSMPENETTPIHNHEGICFYKLLNYRDHTQPILREDKFFNCNRYDDYYDNYRESNIVNTENNNCEDTIITYNTVKNIQDGNINVLYPGDYHQLTAQYGNCYSLHLYFHHFDTSK